MSNANPPFEGEPQNWPPPPAHPLQTIDRFVRSAPQLARALRWIAWAELVVSIVVGLISFFNNLANFLVLTLPIRTNRRAQAQTSLEEEKIVAPVVGGRWSASD